MTRQFLARIADDGLSLSDRSVSKAMAQEAVLSGFSRSVPFFHLP